MAYIEINGRREEMNQTHLFNGSHLNKHYYDSYFDLYFLIPWRPFDHNGSVHVQVAFTSTSTLLCQVPFDWPIFYFLCELQ